MDGSGRGRLKNDPLRYTTVATAPLLMTVYLLACHTRTLVAALV